MGEGEQEQGIADTLAAALQQEQWRLEEVRRLRREQFEARMGVAAEVGREARRIGAEPAEAARAAARREREAAEVSEALLEERRQILEAATADVADLLRRLGTRP